MLGRRACNITACLLSRNRRRKRNCRLCRRRPLRAAVRRGFQRRPLSFNVNSNTAALSGLVAAARSGHANRDLRAPYLACARARSPVSSRGKFIAYTLPFMTFCPVAASSVRLLSRSWCRSRAAWRPAGGRGGSHGCRFLWTLFLFGNAPFVSCKPGKGVAPQL